MGSWNRGFMLGAFVGSGITGSGRMSMTSGPVVRCR